MLELNYINDNKDKIIELLKIKNFDAKQVIEEVIKLDSERKNIQLELDNTLAQSNKIAKEIGIFFKNKQIDRANEAKEETIQLKEKSKKLGEELKKIEENLNQKLTLIPNVPHPTVPKGNSEKDNLLIYEKGQKPNLSKDAMPHWELAQKTSIIDFETGNKVTGAGFPFYKGKGAILQRALINFFLSEAQKEGFIEYQTPILVNEDSGFGTGQLPDKEGQMYHIEKDNLYLIPTAETPLTNIFRNTIVKHSDLPIKITAYTPCFRREAGSYGAHVRGLNRLHQFDKVEIVQIQEPEKSNETLEQMVNYVEKLLEKLELPYRLLKLCGADLSFTSAITYDFEVYSAGQQKWLEVSSISNFMTYQSNRMKLRYKNKENKKIIPHTLNGSALALPRIFATLLENNQTKNYIKIPEILIPFTNFDKIEI